MDETEEQQALALLKRLREAFKSFGAKVLGFGSGVLLYIPSDDHHVSLDLSEAALQWLLPLLEELRDKRAA